MNEQSKATRRRKASSDPRYLERWFTGRGLDVGCGPDPLLKESYPRVIEVIPYDTVLNHANAQFLPEIGDQEFDFVHSSHCLEHLVDPPVALVNWLRVLKPGGYIVCTVPEEFLYEHGCWPSRFNTDHKHSFTLRSTPIIPSSINLLNVLHGLRADVEHLSLMTAGWRLDRFGRDQTLGEAECSIEFVARKPHPAILW